MASHNAHPAAPSGPSERLERATTLLLAASALAAVALVGWGGFVLDAGPLGSIVVALVRAASSGGAIWRAVGDTAVGLHWEDLGLLLGTIVSLLFWWHAVSLIAEVLLLAAASMGWLWCRSLRPLWLILDVLNSAPLAAPKRLVVATALASQVLVRSAGPGLAAPSPLQSTVTVVVGATPGGQVASTQPGQEMPATPDTAPAVLVHRVQPGDTFSGMSFRYFGHAGLWPVLFKANVGAIMAAPAFGLGPPIRLTDPDYLLAGWDAVIPLVAGHLEVGDQGELIYVVQRGDTLSGIAQRFGADTGDLSAANVGAQTPDGHVFEDPDLIWPELRLKVGPVEPAAATREETPPEAVAEPVEAAATPEAPPTTAVPSPSATPASEVSNEQPAPTSVSVPQAVPRVLPTAETPARPKVGEPPLVQWPELLGAGGLSAAVLLALRAGRTRRPATEPENDTQIDTHAFTLAAPAAVVAARRGGGDDPNGVVLGERVTGGLLRHTRAAGLESARVVSVKVGRTGCTVTLEAPLEQRPRLEAILRTASHLARRLTVTRSADQDVVVELDGIQRGVLQRVSLEDCPLLLCVGLQPDTRAYLAGWEALGHVLVATQAGTSDAHEHLASLVATLAGQCAPAELQLYTLAPQDTLLGRLGPLPHQRAVVDPADRDGGRQLVAGVRAELERRQRQAHERSDPELVLAVGELAQLAGNEDLGYLLAHGRASRVRVVAATADTALERAPLVDFFESRLVFALDDEEASTRLLGKPWALTLAEPGRLLARLGRRKEVEILGLHLTENGRQDLLASVGASERTAPVGSATDDHYGPGDLEQVESIEPQGEPEGPTPAARAEGVDRRVEAIRPNGHTAVEDSPIDGSEAAVPPLAAAPTRPRANGHAVGKLAQASDPEPVECPTRIARLLEQARLVIDCENAVVWSAGGQLQLGQSSPVEVLFRLAAAPLLEQGPLDRWPGVKAEDLLEEVWAPRARDPHNRDSSQTWLSKNLERLQEDVRRAAGGLEAELLVKSDGMLRVNPDIAISDVEALMAAVERARAARAAERIAAAEEALTLRVPELLPRAYVERSVIGRRIELYRWLAEPHWERAARRLEAFGHEVTGLLARAYRDAGRHADALVLYAQMLSDDPLDRRAHEGLLVAAAGTGDGAQLHEAWQQICVCMGSEGDLETRGLYERLSREMARAAAGDRSNTVATTGSGPR